MSDGPKQIAAKVEALTAFSDVAFRVDEVLADDRSSADDIGLLIETDVALSAALLKVANSAAYGSRNKIDNTAAALMTVGSRHVRDLAFGMCASQAFEGTPNDLISARDFWKHSVYCAVGAQMIANAAKMCRGTSLFTAGLLHDIGHLAMFSQESTLSREALGRYIERDGAQAVYELEREIFGFDHMEVGAELARAWNFPDTLVAAIQHHHEPSACNEHSDIVSIVHVANSLAVLAELDSENLEDASAIAPEALAKLNFESDEVLFEIVEAIPIAADELLGIFAS
ncbi:MAG: HDOD domain-containing protein [Congregibacter sp.]